ncbi:TetR/AcrR family transcriptional regulator [Kitasatospora camelliae]|uniref:TetR/AcrR family transcriptional regulator n=1 Tax=Kitasatospora camelliae TaxID=3156397 RepID=A0AAU8K4I1_9ACTN
MKTDVLQTPDRLLPGARAGRDPARSIKPGPSRLAPEVVAATQRDRLLDGLVHTVADRGYTHATVSDICRAAGVTRPVFYTLFTGKEDAFLAAHRHGTAVVIRRMAAAFAGAPDWCTGLCEALREMLHLLAAVPAFAVMAVVELDALGPAGRRVREQLLDRFRVFFADCPPPPAGVPAEQLIDAVVGGVHSMVQRCVDSGRTAELPDLLPALSLFCVAPFLGPEEAAARLAVARPSRPTRPKDPSCTLIDPVSTAQ